MTGRRHRRPVVALLALAAIATSLAGCGATDRADTGPPTPTGALAEVETFALALGVDPLDRAAVDRLGAYDLVVVDGSTDGADVAALQRRGARVLGYLSVGTVEPYRPWYRQARREGWLLERWDDWDEWYVDVGQGGFRQRLVAEGRRQVAAGFDGLFLDNTDMVAAHPAQAAGMATLVADLDRAIGQRWLFAQNGDETVATIAAHLDGWNREDVSSTFSFDDDAYRPVPAADARSARATLRRLRGQGLLVTATDYTASGRGEAADAATAAACAAGALPFVSDIDLDRIPSRPRRCP